MSGGFGGLDGCRAGWVLATILPPGGGRTIARTPWVVRVEVIATFADAHDRVVAGELRALAVDMPIGLPTHGQREADRQARRRLGPRRSSIFPTPVRAVLGVGSYAEALQRSRSIDGRGLSKQAYNLLPRIAEVDTRMDPRWQERVVESHPEVAFARLAGAPLSTRKSAPEGRAERATLLRPHLIGVDGADVAALAEQPRPGTKPDDVLDAMAVALTAARVATGTAEHLGDGATDAHGLRMEIVV